MPFFIKPLFTLLFIVCLFSCKNKPHLPPPLFAKDTSMLNEKKNTLLVFVGERLDSQYIPQEKGAMDLHYRAKYRILQNIYGNYSADTITFDTYSHYGIPHFLCFKNALLFISEYEGKYYEEKYQSKDVYMTKSGKWAGAWVFGDYISEGSTIKPQRMDFVNEVFYPATYKDRDGETVPVGFPPEYFNITGDTAVALFGNYVDDIFRLKKAGVLKYRGLFGNKDYKEELEAGPEIEMVEVKPENNNKIHPAKKRR